MIETGGAVEPLRAPVFCICSHGHIAAALRLGLLQRCLHQCFADAAPAGGVADKEVVEVHPPCAELQLHLRAERREAMAHLEELTVAVMGCVVNGPGESKAANIGISLPGTGEAPNCPVYIDGRHATTLRGSYDELAEAFRRLVDEYLETHYAKKRSA